MRVNIEISNFNTRVHSEKDRSIKNIQVEVETEKKKGHLSDKIHYVK